MDLDQMTVAGVAWKNNGGEPVLVALGRGPTQDDSELPAPALTIFHRGRSYRFDGRISVPNISASGSTQTYRFEFRLPRRMRRWSLERLVLHWGGRDSDLPLPAVPASASSSPLISIPRIRAVPDPAAPPPSSLATSDEASAPTDEQGPSSDEHPVAPSVGQAAPSDALDGQLAPREIGEAPYGSEMAEAHEQLARLREQVERFQAELSRLEAETARVRAERDQAQRDRDRVQSERDRVREWLALVEREVRHVVAVGRSDLLEPKAEGEPTAGVRVADPFAGESSDQSADKSPVPQLYKPGLPELSDEAWAMLREPDGAEAERGGTWTAMRFPRLAGGSRVREEQGGSWFSEALRRLAENEPEAAGRALVSLLPAQAVATAGPLRYDLVVRELGIYAVDVDAEGTHIEPRVRPRPMAGTDARITGSLREIGQLLVRPKRVWFKRWRGYPVAVEGDRRRVEDLIRLARTPFRLGELGEVGVKIEVPLLLRMLAGSLVPEWTLGERFTIRFEPTDPPARPRYLQVSDGSPVNVSSQMPLDRPTATVRASAVELIRLLGGDELPEGETSMLSGATEPLYMLQTWIQRLESAWVD